MWTSARLFWDGWITLLDCKNVTGTSPVDKLREEKHLFAMDVMICSRYKHIVHLIFSS